MVDLAAVPPIDETTNWETTIPALQNGWRPTGGAVNPVADEGLLNWPIQALANRTGYLRDRVDRLSRTATVELSVGAGGDFERINDALVEISKYRLSYAPGGVSAKIRLLTGFVMAEQVLVRGINLGWVELVSADPQVQIDRAYLTDDFNAGFFPAFGVSNGGVLPNLRVLFTMMSTGPSANRCGLQIYAGGSATVAQGAGIKSAAYHGAFVYQGGVLDANGADFSGAGRNGIDASGGTRVSFQAGTAVSCAVRGLAASNGAVVHMGYANVGLCSGGGVLASHGASVNATAVKARANGTNDSSNDIAVGAGGTIAAHTAEGGTSQAANTVTSAGVIFK